MNRHLCKGKRIDNGETIIGYYIGNSIQLNDYGAISSHAVDNMSVCRCISRDVNNKLVFEKDVVKGVFSYDFFTDRNESIEGEVIWSTSDLCYYINDTIGKQLYKFSDIASIEVVV